MSAHRTFGRCAAPHANVGAIGCHRRKIEQTQLQLTHRATIDRNVSR